MKQVITLKPVSSLTVDKISCLQVIGYDLGDGGNGISVSIGTMTSKTSAKHIFDNLNSLINVACTYQQWFVNMTYFDDNKAYELSIDGYEGKINLDLCPPHIAVEIRPIDEVVE